MSDSPNQADPVKPKSRAQQPRVACPGSAEWVEWANNLASSQRVPVAILIDLALVAYANQVGFETKPPKR